jgi:hypothetical protein
MNEYDAATIHRQELDREIDSIRTERLLRSKGPPGQNMAGRARSGIGRGLIALGEAVLGPAEATSRSPAGRPASTTGSGRF